ncbi:heavy metal translocating P-type ATPase [Helicobacter mustelae]|uniref:Copper-transporting ATPase n=1 Tax=Helicobacter mustelae (strain ATCC 43772 / CCUG 25715 / CIP 103759 / LMG 18044 / NCTC 12198 / R85-136P) TaxID=679897 RepID=D3UHB4_HELM1|nr:heavy metal translocating P-type ATPase [Helicobacter mustelae]CBG39886.1 putative cation-transporting ATPase [Helicobacter mustelae 12198]SQH71396.1 cation-transporting ATPase [Helicobacter mustelae]
MTKCDHCRLEYPDSALHDISYQGRLLHFCCKGCENVYFLLHEKNLESFYGKLKSQTLTPPKTPDSEALAIFDTPSFLSRYAHKDAEGRYHISLVLEGIHCLACTWLIEQSLQNQNGIHTLSLNYTNNKLKITYNPEEITLKEIIKIIQILGYDAKVYDPKISENTHTKQRQSYYFAMMIAIFCTMNIMWIAVAQYAGYFSDISPTMKNVLNLASFLLATPVLFWTGKFFYVSAYHQLKNRIIGMDLLVSTGAFLTYFYSIYAALSKQGETYFEAVSMIITFVFVGKFLEVQAKKNAGDNLDSLSNMLPTQVGVIEEGMRVMRSPHEVEIGSIIEVLPNEILAIDGILTCKEALLNTQNISGESFPILKHTGDELLSGSINTQSTLRYQTTKAFCDSLLFRLVNILENSLSQKPQIQNLANSLSQIFSKCVLLIAGLSFFYWHFLEHASFEYSLMIAISVIIISCPCALALATPIASIVGISEALKQKIIFKETKFLETIARANILCLDKTGTLTKGKPKVLEAKTFQNHDPQILISLLDPSKHVIAQSIKSYLQENSPFLQAGRLEDFQEFLGKGMSAVDARGRKILGGSLAFLQENQVDTKEIGLGNPIAFGYSINGNLCGVFFLQDEPKEHAREFIARMQTQIPRIVLLSGDHQKSVALTAEMLGIKEFYANLLPLQKAEFIKKHQDQIIIMVGDGFNDAAALQQSNVGIAFHSQNHFISLTSDIILLNPSLENLENTFYIAKKTYKTIRQNLALSICYNLALIPLAVCGFIIPLFAALSMSLSSLLVIGNSLRIKKSQKK